MKDRTFVESIAPAAGEATAGEFPVNPQLPFPELYRRFDAPVTAVNCGERCAPHNERGVPFCCDIHHAIPTAYTDEWEYLQAKTDLWRPWQGRTPKQTGSILRQLPEGQTAIACQGHLHCQRLFRSITCRAFPFFPYITPEGEFIGMTYAWEYEDRCWVISNLHEVTDEFRAQFTAFYDDLFCRMADEHATFRHHSSRMRRIFARRRRAIPLLHRNGLAYKITPRTGRMRRVDPLDLPAFGPYRIARELPFPDEL
jgi:hypothetical protein